MCGSASEGSPGVPCDGEPVFLFVTVYSRLVGPPASADSAGCFPPHREEIEQ